MISSDKAPQAAYL